MMLGFLAGCTVWQLDRTGYFVTWTELPPPPQVPSEFIISREFDLYIRTQDGDTLKWNNQSWGISKVPEDIDVGWNITAPCIQEWPQFSPLAHAPIGIRDCIQDEGVYAEFNNKHVYVLDIGGRIWQWELLRHGLDDLLLMVSYPCVGTLVGFVFTSIVLIVLRKIEGKGQDESKSDPRE